MSIPVRSTKASFSDVPKDPHLANNMSRELTLPLYPSFSIEQVDRICDPTLSLWERVG